MLPGDESEGSPAMKNDGNVIIIHLELHRAQTHFHRKRLSEMSVCLQQQTERQENTLQSFIQPTALISISQLKKKVRWLETNQASSQRC